MHLRLRFLFLGFATLYFGVNIFLHQYIAQSSHEWNSQWADHADRLQGRSGYAKSSPYAFRAMVNAARPSNTQRKTNDKSNDWNSLDGRAVRLTVFTHNVFFLPSVARFFLSGFGGLTTDLKRAKGLADKLVLHNFDVVCLMETFREAPRTLIMEKLKAAKYHVIEKFNEDTLFNANAGLSFASKYPIVDWGFEEFTSREIRTSDYWAQKGVGFVLIDVTNPIAQNDENDAEGGDKLGPRAPRFVCVFLTHVQAQTEGRSVRAAQFEQMRSLIHRKLQELPYPNRTSVFIAGDFNVDGLRRPAGEEELQEEYSDMVRLLSQPIDVWRAHHKSMKLLQAASKLVAPITKKVRKIKHKLQGRNGETQQSQYAGAEEDEAEQEEEKTKMGPENDDEDEPIDKIDEASTNEGQRIDYIFYLPSHIGAPLVTPGLESVKVEKGWKTEEGDEPLSDHDPVVATFTLRGGDTVVATTA